MSLINQMLRDLESRRRTSGELPVAGDVPKPVTHSSETRRLLILVVAGLLLIGIVWIGLEILPAAWLVPQPKPKALTAEEHAFRIVMEREDALARLSEKTATKLETSVTAKRTASPHPENKSAIVAPVASEPKHTERAAAQNAVTEKGAAPTVNSGQSTVKERAHKIEVATPLRQPLKSPPPSPAVASKPISELIRKPLPVVRKFKKTERALSKEEQAKRAYQTGLAQLEKRDRQAAEVSFSHAVSLHPRLLEARLQLINLLLMQQRISEADTQLQSGLKLHPDSPELRKTYARLLLSEEQLEGAIGILIYEPLPDVVSDLEYHAMLAALFQEAGEHTAAVKQYTKLLEVRPRESLWWMGIAIALEQSGDLAQARKAYRQALETPGLRPDLENYIRDRLQVL